MIAMRHPLFRAALAGLALASSASAGGLYLSEFATSDMGAAGSGSLARGEDAGSVLNPASMTRLESHQLQLGLAPGFGVVQFDADADTPVPGGNGGNQGGFIPLLSSAYVHRVSERVRAGIGLLSLSGAGLDPSNHWGGRFQLTELTLFTLSAVPSLAVRVTDWLSVGAGAFLTYGRLDWKLRVPLPGAREGQVRFDGIDDFQAAALVGVLLEPHDRFRLGVVYQSKTDLELSGDVDLPGNLIGSLDVELELPLAQAVWADAIWQVTPELALSIGGGWENWDQLADTDITLGPIESNVRVGFKDSWKLRGGIHYQLDEHWRVQTGVSYDSSALESDVRSAALPIDEQWRVGVGAVHRWTESRTFGFSFQYVNLGDARIDNASLKGDYEDNHLFFFQMSLNFARLPWEGRASF